MCKSLIKKRGVLYSASYGTPQMIKQTHLRPQKQIKEKKDDVAHDEDPDEARRDAEQRGQHASNPAAVIAAATTTPTSWLHKSPQEIHSGSPEDNLSATSFENVHAELTTTNLTVCKRCRQKIKKGDMRIGIRSTDLQGRQILPWHHCYTPAEPLGVLTTCYLLLATCYLLLTTHYSLLTTHYSLPTTHLQSRSRCCR